jgi:hypothetical protein
VAHGGAARYLPAMPAEHVHPEPKARSPIFSRAEICWLWVMVLAAVVVSATAALISDRTIADLLGGGSEPAPQQTNANG